jgi:hypothetical protein
MASNGHLDPAKKIIERLGGVNVVATVTGKHRSQVFRWMYPPERGGTGGLIPQRTIPALLEYAKSEGIKLRPADFMMIRAKD